MNKEIKSYIDQQKESDKEICYMLAYTIYNELKEAESKIWHAHPVWFLNENPQLDSANRKKEPGLFWNGADFDEEKLNVKKGKFKDASIFFNFVDEIELNDLKHWLINSREIQWDYKNLVKRKGQLVKL